MAYKRSRKDYETDFVRHSSPFVLYGTALPPLDDQTRDDGSYVPVWKQEVTDDRGRKRLHGAFTGGFSAGYFNTVGSKEGWSPATFVSSRTNRAKDASSQIQQKAEDFMDEEDIREQDESKHLSTGEGFAGFGTADDSNRANAFIDLFRPGEDTIGMKLLNKMGWKQGQGIGPKIRRLADSEDCSSKVHLLAPNDTPMLSFVRKTDQRGLGYVAQIDERLDVKETSTHSRLPSYAQSDKEDEGSLAPQFPVRRNAALQRKQGAFGVGILNDTGSDEEDAYSIGPHISYNKTLDGGKKLKKTKALLSTTANPLLKKKPVFISKKIGTISNSLKKCHDGRLPLDGFVLVNELDGLATVSPHDVQYKPPPVPEGWKPAKAAALDSIVEANQYQSPADVARSSNHTAATRGTLLGEAVLPGKSVFDFLSPAAREKLTKATGNHNLPPARGEFLPGTSSSVRTPLDIRIPSLDRHTALQALSRIVNGSFTPYADDASKAARYKSFLESQANEDKVSNSLTRRPDNVKEEDYTNELYEFARTAEIFKPASGLIAMRFTTSTTSVAPTTSDSTDATANRSDPAMADLLTRPAERPKDPAEEAARVGMFGQLTRSIANFYPTRLLCKRFEVAMPSHTQPKDSCDDIPAAPSVSDKSKFDKTGNNRFQSAGFHYDDKVENLEIDMKTDHRQESPRPDGVQGIGHIDPPRQPQPTTDASFASDTEPLSRGGRGITAATAVDPDRNDALEQERPGAAVFRAIFGSDDDDDEDEDNNND